VNQEDKHFMSQFAILVGALVVFTIVMFFLARYLMGVNAPDYGPLIARQQEQRLEPAGQVQTGKVKQTTAEVSGGGSAKGATSTGQQTYTTVCATCHDSGVAGAPMISDQGAWQARIAQGKQTLYQHAINGLGAMPPKGGDPSLSNTQVQAAVDYMVAQVGGGAPEQPAASKAQPAGGKQAKAAAPKAQPSGGKQAKAAAPAIHATSTPEGKSTYQIMCANCHDAGALGAPMITDSAAWQARLAKGKQALYASAMRGIGAMPAKGGHPQLSDDEVKAAVDHIIATVSDSSGGKQQSTTASTKAK
jgi:cytochrome c5